MSSIGSGVGGYFAYKNSLSSLVEGQTVICTTDSPIMGGIFRVVDGKLNYYPSPAILTSWNPNSGNPNSPDALKSIPSCSGIAQGPNMELKV